MNGASNDTTYSFINPYIFTGFTTTSSIGTIDVAFNPSTMSSRGDVMALYKEVTQIPSLAQSDRCYILYEFCHNGFLFENWPACFKTLIPQNKILRQVLRMYGAGCVGSGA